MGAMAIMINGVEGEQWKHSKLIKGSVRNSFDPRHGSYGTFDEVLWFTMTTLHGVGFGEYVTVTTKGDYLAAVMVAVSYWCTIFMAAIIMLSQLPGGDPPG